MLCHYKKPGDWLWTAHETPSLAADAASGRVGRDWRFRLYGETEARSLEEMLEIERSVQERASAPGTEAEAALLAPDGTWGIIMVIMSLAALAFLAVVPTRDGSSPLSLVGFALVLMGSGIRQIMVARAWKKHHSPKKPNQAMQRTAGRSAF